LSHEERYRRREPGTSQCVPYFKANKRLLLGKEGGIGLDGINQEKCVIRRLIDITELLCL